MPVPLNGHGTFAPNTPSVIFVPATPVPKEKSYESAHVVPIQVNNGFKTTPVELWTGKFGVAVNGCVVKLKIWLFGSFPRHPHAPQAAIAQ